MTEKMELYKCQVCGNLIQVILNGVGELVCCGQSMEKLIAKEESGNELAEKHTPEFVCENDKKYIKLTRHPMTEEHYIQFIEAYSKDNSKIYLKYLNPNEKAEFEITNFNDDIGAIEYCNIHGLWRNKNEN